MVKKVKSGPPSSFICDKCEEETEYRITILEGADFKDVCGKCYREHRK